MCQNNVIIGLNCSVSLVSENSVLMLPDVQYLKTVVSLILSNLLVVHCVKTNMVPWPQTEILCNFISYNHFGEIFYCFS